MMTDTSNPSLSYDQQKPDLRRKESFRPAERDPAPVKAFLQLAGTPYARQQGRLARAKASPIGADGC